METIDWERLEISSTKSEIQREYFMQQWAQLKDRNSMDLTEAEEVARIHRTIQKRS